MSEIVKIQMWFDDNVWNQIKAFAGYSNNYPTNLSYYTRMLGFRPRKPYFMSKKKGTRRIITLEDHIDDLWIICDDYEELLIDRFAPKPRPKTRDEMRIEWDSKYGEGDFDNDDYC